MSDNLNETNNEINETKTAENKTDAIEEQHTEDVTEATQVAAKVVEDKTTSQTVAVAPVEKKNGIGSKVIATVGKGALAVLCGFGGAWLYTAQSGNGFE